MARNIGGLLRQDVGYHMAHVVGAGLTFTKARMEFNRITDS